MLSKCANPSCSTPFVYLRDGKIFKLESEGERPGPTLVSRSKPARRVEHFWLCGNCAPEMTVTFDAEMGVHVVPKAPLVRRAVAS